MYPTGALPVRPRANRNSQALGKRTIALADAIAETHDEGVERLLENNGNRKDASSPASLPQSFGLISSHFDNRRDTNFQFD
jgi:hypothetical protein